MTRTMFDATHDLVPNIPLDAQMVAGYLPPSAFAWTPEDWARFPNAVRVRIAVRASTDDGHVLDVESGDATPSEAPGWVVMRRAAGADPTVYCSESLWPTVRAAFQAAGVTEPHYWVAAYPGGGAIIPAGAVAHQYMDAGIYDKSIVADYWPGVDGADMELTDSIGANSSGQPVTVLNAFDVLYAAVADSKAAPGGNGTLFDQLGALQKQIAALTGALSTDEAAILAAIAALPTGQPPTDAQMATLTAAVVKALPGYTVNITPTAPTTPTAL